MYRAAIVILTVTVFGLAACGESAPKVQPLAAQSSPSPTGAEPTAPPTSAPTNAPATPTPVPATATAVRTATPQFVFPTSSGASLYFANCDAARRAGKAPILRGEPGYRADLDRDNDGIACE